MTIKKNKCEQNCDKVSNLGYQISKDGILPDERLAKKIAEMSILKNKKELESFMGQTIFCSKYLPRYYDLREPFAKLRKKNTKFNWTHKETLILKHF